jgi:hypothetical protein
MLRIYVYGPMEQGWLDTEPGTVLQLEGLAPAFDEELSTSEFSLPIPIPWTDHNKMLLGFTERLENFNRGEKSFRCDVYDNVFPELVNAQLTILEKSGKFSYRKGSFNATISGTEGLFGTLIRNKKLTDLELGGKIEWTGKESRKFAEDLMKGLYPQYTDRIGFAPLAIEGFIDTARPDYGGEFLARDTVNNVVYKPGSGANAWTFGRPKSTDPSLSTDPGDPEHLDFRTIPFFRAKYILKQCFIEFGFRVTGDFLEGTDFDDLYMYNNYAVEDYLQTSAADMNRKITPSNHMPPMLIADFLKGIFGFFNVYPVFLNNNEVRLIYRYRNFTNRNILSISLYTGTDFKSTYPSPDTERGYTLQYNWGQDGYGSDQVKDLSNKIMVGSVATAIDLLSLDPGYALTTDHIAWVLAENLYYVVADATSTPIKWEVYGEALEDYVHGDGEKKIEVSLSTFCRYIVFNPVTGLYEKRNYLGTKQTGSYRTYRGAWNIAEFGLHIFYIQKRVYSGVNIPITFYHSRNESNQVVVKHSLAWAGDEGIAESFHNQWWQLRERGEIVETDTAMNPRILKELKEHNVYEHYNVLYLPYHLERTIPMSETAVLQVMPL